MKILVITPVVSEIDGFVSSCSERGLQAETMNSGRLPVRFFRDLDMGVALGGLGKVQFAVHTQHLLEVWRELDAVVCAGTAGSLTDAVGVGDVIVATETVEHDIRNRFGPVLTPRFSGAAPLIDAFRNMAVKDQRFQVHFGPIASGDEDIVDLERGRAIQQSTGAIAVAWEGAGGARACQFSGVPFVEVRGISDGADANAAADFRRNRRLAMENIVEVVIPWARQFQRTHTVYD